MSIVRKVNRVILVAGQQSQEPLLCLRPFLERLVELPEQKKVFGRRRLFLDQVLQQPQGLASMVSAFLSCENDGLGPLVLDRIAGDRHRLPAAAQAEQGQRLLGALVVAVRGQHEG